MSFDFSETTSPVSAFPHPYGAFHTGITLQDYFAIRLIVEKFPDNLDMSRAYSTDEDIKVFIRRCYHTANLIMQVRNEK